MQASNVAVTSMRPWQASELRQLFRQGLFTDFDYFPQNYLKATDRANSTLRLAWASLRPERLMYIARSGDKNIGYVIAAITEPVTCYIFWLYVLPDQRGRHIGQQLLQVVLDEAKRRKLARVVLATHQYGEFYARQGFELMKKRNFSIGDTTMYIMELNISDSVTV